MGVAISDSRKMTMNRKARLSDKDMAAWKAEIDCCASSEAVKKVLSAFIAMIRQMKPPPVVSQQDKILRYAERYRWKKYHSGEWV